MSKLFRLKEWVTVVDAAKHLSNLFEEEVTKADVLRLALDRRLPLSVYFVNYTRARLGKIARHTEEELHQAIAAGTPLEDLEWQRWPPGAMAAAFPDLPPEEAEEMNGLICSSLKISEDEYLTLKDEVTVIKGVWDLVMIGNEVLDIEHQYQELIGGPDVTLQGLEGVFVKNQDGVVGQLQADYDNNEYQPGSSAQLGFLEEKIRSKKLNKKDAASLLKKYKEDREIFLEGRKGKLEPRHYYPAGGLSQDHLLVVRVKALNNFESVFNEPPKKERELSTNERNSLLTVLAALCDYSAINVSERGASRKIAEITEEFGAPLTDDTIRKFLRQMPEAVSGRTK